VGERDCGAHCTVLKAPQSASRAALTVRETVPISGTCRDLWSLMLTILMPSFKALALLEFEGTFDQMTTPSKKLGLNTSSQNRTQVAVVLPIHLLSSSSDKQVPSSATRIMQGHVPPAETFHCLHIVASSQILASDHAQQIVPASSSTKENVGLSSQM
jgi:hypothetical protein